MQNESNREKLGQALESATPERASFRLGRIFVCRLHHVIKYLFEFLQTSGRNDDIIAPAVDVFRNAQEASPRIFLKRKQKGLSLDLNLVAL